MKKILLSLIIFISSFSAFSNIMVQGNFAPCAGLTYFAHSCFETDAPSFFDMGITLPADLDFSIMWEFSGEDTEKDFHLFTGLNVGLPFLFYIQVSPIVGFSKNLLKLNNWRLEMVTSGQIGVSASLFGNDNFYFQENLDFVFLKNNRKGLYAGVGVTNLNIIRSDLFVGYGTITEITSGFALRLLAGVRI